MTRISKELREHIAGLASKEEKHDAIARASTPEQLYDLWEVWSSQGFSNEGQLHGAVLRRIADLVPLSEDELKLVEKIDAETARGRALPPIRGTMKGGGQ